MITTYERQALQMFRGAVWDGDLISKLARDNLVKDGRAFRRDGYNCLTPDGVTFVVSNHLHDAPSMHDPQPTAGDLFTKL